MVREILNIKHSIPGVAAWSSRGDLGTWSKGLKMLHHFLFIRLLPTIWPLYWSQSCDTDRKKNKAPESLKLINIFYRDTNTESRGSKSKDPQGTLERWSILGLRVLDLLRTLPHTLGNCTMGNSILQSLAWGRSWCPHHFLHFQICLLHLRHIRQQGVVLCLGPIAAGWSESTLSGLIISTTNL